MALRPARVLVVALLIAPVLGNSAGVALACSCGSSHLANAIREPGRAAFVGEVIQVASDGGIIRYRFRVEEAVAGDIGDEVVAESTVSGTACGVDLAIGQRAAFVLGRRGHTWIASSCGRTDPVEMLHAASFLGFLQSWAAVPWYAAAGIPAFVAVFTVIRSHRRSQAPRA